MIAKASPPTPLFTVGQIALYTRQPVHRVTYIIQARGIRETARAGRARIYALESVERIKRELQAIDAGGQQ